MTRRSGERGPDQTPRKRRTPSLRDRHTFEASTDRAVRPFGSDAGRVAGWCYVCESSHLFGEPCQERRR